MGPKELAHPARLERATCGFEVRRSIQLSYGCALLIILHLKPFVLFVLSQTFHFCAKFRPDSALQPYRIRKTARRIKFFRLCFYQFGHASCRAVIAVCPDADSCTVPLPPNRDGVAVTIYNDLWIHGTAGIVCFNQLGRAP
jgi:hypothetical protein